MSPINQHYPDLAGRVAVVTGGSRGIGAGTARALAGQGATVVATGRDQAALQQVVESIRSAGGQAYAVAADLTDEADVDRLRDEAQRHGPVDVVCAFAGGQGNPVRLTDLTLAGWRSTVDVNLTSTFLTLRAFLPAMVRQGHGSIITMASTAGRQVSPASPAYGAAKAGLLMLTRQAALEVAPYGVRVNALAPGSVLDDKPVPAQVRAEIAAAHPLGRTGTADDIAGIALFLASDASSWITGATVDVNGGRIMQ